MKINALLNKIRDYKYSSYIIALVLMLGILFQCILFHWFVYGSLSYFPVATPSIILKLSLGVFISSFSLLTKNKYWTIIVSFILAFWCMAELIYFRSNNIFIEEYSMTMVGNMNGVWDSIWLFSHVADWLFLLPTAILIGLIILFKEYKRHISAFIILILLSLILNYWSCIKIHRGVGCGHKTCEHGIEIINPFKNEHDGTTYLGFTTEQYLCHTSVLHSFVFQIKDLILLPFKNEKYNLTEEEKILADKFINKGTITSPNSPIIILLIESFESWTISPGVTPNLYKFINDTPSMLYADKMIPQVRHGVSADGQMIVDTGLLPITDGAACFRFPDNEYPAISKLYENSGLIAALSLAYWNQKFMSDSYGIKKNYVVESWHDKDMFNKVSEVKSDHDFLLSLTMTMHAPFNSCPEKEYPQIEDMPDEIYRYLNSVKYMDKYLGNLLADLISDPKTKDATIVVTADHNVLSQESRNTFNVFNKERNLGFGEINGYIPFIVYSPRIKSNVKVKEPVYQMDIYPTLLGLLGCENYYWKGFGVNLLNEGSWNNRPIQAHEAQILSDKIIRANYFNN